MFVGVLEGLHSVPWARLEIAGVSDRELPELLRTIAAGDEQSALDALHELRWEILHQGTMYSATAPAARFLAELLEVTVGAVRGYIVELLGDLARSSDLDDLDDDPVYTEVGTTVAAEVDRMLPLLADADPWTRYAAAYAVSGCPSRAAEIQPALLQRWAVEPDPRVRAGLVMAAATLDRRTDLVNQALGPDNPPAVRAGAVLAAAQSGRRWPGKRAVDAVRAAWRDGDPFAAGDGEGWQPTVFVPEALEELLDRLQPADRAPIVAALLDSPDPQVRMRAAMQAGTAIGESRSVRKPLTDVLIPSLTDADPRVRVAAADAIRRAGPLGAHAADALAAVVDHYDDEAAGQALAALVDLDDPRAAQRLPASIRSGNAADDIGAALIEAGTAMTAEILDAVRFRLGALRTERPRQRQIDVLRSVPGRGQYDDQECATLLMLVRSWGPAAAPAVEELAGLLRADRLAERVIDTLAAIGPGAAAALPALRAHADKVRRNRDQELLAVARACWRLTGDPEPAIDEAWRGIKRGNIGGDPIALLDEIGDPVRRLLPEIQAALPEWMANCEWYHSDRLAMTRMAWQWTGDPTPALSYAHIFLGLDMGGYGRIEAAILAGELGDATSVAALIQVASEDGSYAQRVRACRALWRLTGDPDPGLSALLKSMTTADYAPTKGSWAPMLDLLAELGPVAAPFVPHLKRLAERDATVARPSAAENPGLADEQTRAAIRATIQVIENATPEIGR